MGSTDRREFIKIVAAGSGAALLPDAVLAAQATGHDAPVSPGIVGPRPGFTPELGTLVSMMGFMRAQVLRSVKGLNQADLDHLLDAKANSIGALLLHLAATETFYQLHTFQGLAWGAWPEAVNKQWKTAMQLGEAGRKGIKGRDLDDYLGLLAETRANTLAEFRKRDDQWLFAVDKNWSWGPTNNYCKWFHVCEHESNHNGQIKLLKGRLNV